MANPDAPSGLRPVGISQPSGYSGKVSPYFINASYATALFRGDPVTITGTSNTAFVTVPGIGRKAIGTLPEVNKTAAGDGNPLSGVIVAFGANPDDLSVTYSPASTEGVCWVADDPYQVFEIQADGPIPATSMGLNAVLIYTNAGSTVTGLSGAELDTTSDPPAADASNQLTILRAVDREDNDTTLTHAKVLVRINNHTNAHGAIGI